MGKEKKGGVPVETREVVRTHKLPPDQRIAALQQAAQRTSDWLEGELATMSVELGISQFDQFRYDPDEYIRRAVAAAARMACLRTLERLETESKSLNELECHTKERLYSCRQSNDILDAYGKNEGGLYEAHRDYRKILNRLRTGESLGSCAVLATILTIYRQDPDELGYRRPYAIVPTYELGGNALPLARGLRNSLPKRIAENPLKYCRSTIRREVANLREQLSEECPDALLPQMNGWRWSERPKKGPWHIEDTIEFNIPSDVLKKDAEAMGRPVKAKSRVVIPVHQANSSGLKRDMIGRLRGHQTVAGDAAGEAFEQAIDFLCEHEDGTPLYAGQIIGSSPMPGEVSPLSICLPSDRDWEDVQFNRPVPRVRVRAEPKHDPWKSNDFALARGFQNYVHNNPDMLLDVDFVGKRDVRRGGPERKALSDSPLPIHEIYDQGGVDFWIRVPPYVDAAYRPDNAQ